MLFYIWNLPGAEGWEGIRVYSEPPPDVVILCFAVDDPKSLEAIRVRSFSLLNKGL